MSLNLIDSILDKKLFGRFFKDIRSWANWLILAKVLSGRPLDADELQVFRECPGLDEPPKEQPKEIFLCCGRRSGKSTFSALLGAFYGIWGGWQEHLQPGEEAKIFIISPNMAQGKIVTGYVKALLHLKPFRQLIRKELQDSIELKTGVSIEIKPASWRSTRGFSVGLLILEEAAYFRFETESQLRDKEIYIALKPSTATIENSLIVGCSSPFTKQGLLWEKSKAWGKPGPVLFWRAPTWKMNLSLTEEGLRQEYGETLSEAEFNCEFGAVEREDIEDYIPPSILDAAIITGRKSLPPQPGVTFFGFADFSEGLRKGSDSAALAITHREGEKAILDLLLEFEPPFDPKKTIKDMADACHQYQVDRIIQDRHAIAYIGAELRQYGIRVEPSDYDKSRLYEFFATQLSAGQVELLDNPKLRSQILGLQRFLRGGGTAKIDHLTGRHDDVVNVASGSCAYPGLRPRPERRIIWLEDEPSLPPFPLTPPPPWIEAMNTTENVITFAALLRAGYIIVDAAKKMGLRLETLQEWRNLCAHWIAEKEGELADEIAKQAERYKEEHSLKRS